MPLGIVRVMLATFIEVAPTDADAVKLTVIFGKYGVALKEAKDCDLTNNLPPTIDCVAILEVTMYFSVTARAFELVIPLPSRVIKSFSRTGN